MTSTLSIPVSSSALIGLLMFEVRSRLHSIAVPSKANENIDEIGTLIESLAYASFADIERLCSAGESLGIEVSIRPSTMLQHLRRAHSQTDIQELQRYLIRAGASLKLMGRWFSMSRQKYESLRALESIPPRSMGRAVLPHPAVRSEVQAAFAAISAEEPTLSEPRLYAELHRRLALAKSEGSKLDVKELHSTVNEEGFPGLRRGQV